MSTRRSNTSTTGIGDGVEAAGVADLAQAGRVGDRSQDDARWQGPAARDQQVRLTAVAIRIDSESGQRR
ncbi:hypothetical protein ACH4OY_32065 [Micromonospora rubida]|uniref:Uncharacterized protein n=1 Tax=Micromonospora rubida TaxID=2697657 RepID=A0ABW7SYA6_9ACTN